MGQFFGISLNGVSGAALHQGHSLKLAVLEFLRPKPCPFPLIRIGGNRDGAYLLPDDLRGIEACYSPGVNNYKYFEDMLLEQHAISSHMCDRSSDIAKFTTPLIKGKQTFRKLWLDVTNDTDAISLKDWVMEENPGNSDLLLQIDIEGAEYRNILSTPNSVLRRFRIIVIELHSLSALNDLAVLETVIAPFTEKLAENFVTVHAHPNNCAPMVKITGTEKRIPPVLEITLLRRDRFEGHPPSAYSSPELPHPLDVAQNVTDRAPVFLDDNWMEETPSETVRLRRMTIERDYYLNLHETLENEQSQHHAIARELKWLVGTLSNHVQTYTQVSLSRREVGQGKSYKLSAAFGGGSDTGKVHTKVPFFCHSAIIPGPRLTIDLEQQYELQEVKIFNRTDVCQSRADGLFVILHNSPDPETGTGFIVSTPASFLQKNPCPTSVDLPGIKARYVTVTSPFRTALHFSDIQIFAASDEAALSNTLGAQIATAPKIATREKE